MSEMWGQRFSPSLPSLQALDTETQRGRGTSVRTQTPDPGTCPTLAQPHICPRRAGGWWGTWCQAPEAGWEAEWSLAPPPPQAAQPGSIHPAAQLPAHPPRPGHQSTPGPLLPLSFLPSSSHPNSSLFFFLLSLFQHVITVETKSEGTMRALMAAPSRPPPPVVRASTLSTRPGLEPLPKEPC